MHTLIGTSFFPLVSLNFGFRDAKKREITAESGSGSMMVTAYTQGNVNPPGLTRRHGAAPGTVEKAVKTG